MVVCTFSFLHRLIVSDVECTKIARILRPANLSHRQEITAISGSLQAVLDGVPRCKVRKGAFDALNEGSEALGKVTHKAVAQSGAPPEELYEVFSNRNFRIPIWPSESPALANASSRCEFRAIFGVCLRFDPCEGNISN